MHTFTLAIDDREKRPILFPANVRHCGHLYKVVTVRKRLAVADYKAISEGFLRVGIERKSSPSELYSCFCGQERARAERQLARLASAFERAYLLVDSTPTEVLMYRYQSINPALVDGTGEVVLQNVIDTAARHHISLIWAQRADGGPRAMVLGRVVLALLMSPPTPEKKPLDFLDARGIVKDSREHTGLIIPQTSEDQDGNAKLN